MIARAPRPTREPFYAARGYYTRGGHFVDAGIEHVRMEKRPLA